MHHTDHYLRSVWQLHYQHLEAIFSCWFCINAGIKKKAARDSRSTFVASEAQNLTEFVAILAWMDLSQGCPTPPSSLLDPASVFLFTRKCLPVYHKHGKARLGVWDTKMWQEQGCVIWNGLKWKAEGKNGGYRFIRGRHITLTHPTSLQFPELSYR